ncbi:hypothetical protein PENTCL1PPCAC_1145, partial [Pristionchus entomophagus]
RRMEAVLSTPATPPPPSTPPTPIPAPAPSYSILEDLDRDEHVVFVEAHSNKVNDEVFLWIVDDPQQAMLWGCKGKGKPPVGSFIRAHFKKQTDGRLYCKTEDYEACGAPSDIKVFFQHGQVKVWADVSSENHSQGENEWKNKYLGVVEDIHRRMPRNVLDREKYLVQIAKRKQGQNFVWAIERILRKRQTYGSTQNGSAVRGGTTRDTVMPLKNPPSRGGG